MFTFATSKLEATGTVFTGLTGALFSAFTRIYWYGFYLYGPLLVRTSTCTVFYWYGPLLVRTSIGTLFCWYGFSSG